jgi:hypothetical protein
MSTMFEVWSAKKNGKFVEDLLYTTWAMFVFDWSKLEKSLH